MLFNVYECVFCTVCCCVGSGIAQLSGKAAEAELHALAVGRYR